MRKRSRAAEHATTTPPPPAATPDAAPEGAGLGLDSLFEHQHDAVGDRPSRDTRRDPEVSRTRRPAFLAVVIGVALVAVAALVVRTTLEDDSPSPAAPTSARSDVGAPPAELPKNGTAIQSRLTPDGDVVVTQWIRNRFPVTDIGIRTPPDDPGAARVGEVTVVADGETVGPLRNTADPTLRFVFGVPARLVYVRYVLTRALDISSSVPGRALVRTTFLRVDYGPLQGPTVVTVKAPEVLSMTCSNPRTVLSTPRPCGAPTAGGWRVTLRQDNRQDDVMAQVGLRG